MDISKLAQKIDVKIEFYEEINGKRFMKLPQLTKDFDNELFNDLSNAVTKFLKRQSDEILRNISPPGKYSIVIPSSEERLRDLVNLYNSQEFSYFSADFLIKMDIWFNEICHILKEHPELGVVKLKIYNTIHNAVPITGIKFDIN